MKKVLSLLILLGFVLGLLSIVPTHSIGSNYTKSMNELTKSNYTVTILLVWYHNLNYTEKGGNVSLYQWIETASGFGLSERYNYTNSTGQTIFKNVPEGQYGLAMNSTFDDTLYVNDNIAFEYNLMIPPPCPPHNYSVNVSWKNTTTPIEGANVSVYTYNRVYSGFTNITGEFIITTWEYFVYNAIHVKYDKFENKSIVCPFPYPIGITIFFDGAQIPFTMNFVLVIPLIAIMIIIRKNRQQKWGYR